MLQFVRVEFYRFKAFKRFTLELKHFNILVGPNNAGKSTILAAFRILAAAMRRAGARKAKLLRGPEGAELGYDIDLTAISVAEENIFYNYDDSEAAYIIFRLSNKSSLTLHFPEQGVCFLFAESGRDTSTPSLFRKHFNCPIGFVPILGPVDHHEPLYEKEAARLALFNYRAARNFRNIWHHYPEYFDDFRSALLQTWPGMDIERPEIDLSHDKPRLHMYCPEARIPRELFWAGFGFQVWCQMLTHLIQSRDVSLFLIDEPDIYLHSELQRQLSALLRSLGPDILLATHSTEIVTEAETDDIVLVNKARQSARRIRDPSQLEEVFGLLGSNMNPILTQLAKTRRVVFVEGRDFQILSRFARKLGVSGVANRRDFAVVSVEGFNPERVRNLKAGMETTLGAKILTAVVLDRDYRSDMECASIGNDCGTFCDSVTIHKCKEIENFLLVASALDRAASRRVADAAKRGGEVKTYRADIEKVLDQFSDAKKSYVMSRFLAERRRFERTNSPGKDEAEVHEEGLNSFETLWGNPRSRLDLVPGKEALAFINKHLQESYGVSITPTAVVEAMYSEEMPQEMVTLIRRLEEFSATSRI